MQERQELGPLLACLALLDELREMAGRSTVDEAAEALRLEAVRAASDNRPPRGQRAEVRARLAAAAKAAQKADCK